MTMPLRVCVLGAGDWPATNAAVASARRHGLEVIVGHSGQEKRGAPHPEARVVAVAWRDDFAAARNQLAAAAGDARPLLWLDSDERLEAFPAGGISFAGGAAAVRIIDRDDLTPRPILRLQGPGTTWRHAIHETLGPITTAPPLVAGVLIRHHGYDDAVVVAAKRRRNRRIVAAERARGADYFALALEEARAASGGAAVMAWLRVFNHARAAPTGPGDFDRRHEAAEELCALGYPEPARTLLAVNPDIVALHLALLAAEHAGAGEIDGRRLAWLVALLKDGGGDRRYAFPRVLLGADAAGVLDWLGAGSAATLAETAR